jgi:hypothetical protein
MFVPKIDDGVPVRKQPWPKLTESFRSGWAGRG